MVLVSLGLTETTMPCWRMAAVRRVLEKGPLGNSKKSQGRKRMTRSAAVRALGRSRSWKPSRPPVLRGWMTTTSRRLG